MEYSLPDCVDSYQDPCPIFAPEDGKEDKEVTSLTMSLRDQIDFNICDTPNNCRCNVNTEFEPSGGLVAGEEDVLKLGRLTLTNTGDEPSIQNSLSVRVDSSKFRFNRNADGLRSCRESSGGSGEIVCDLPFLNVKGVDNESKRTFQLDVTPLEIIEPSITSIAMHVKTNSTCSGEHMFEAS